MTTTTLEGVNRVFTRPHSVSIQRYARTAGALILVSIVFGTLGELVIPSKIIVSTDAAATARNVTMLQPLFRFGFAAYLVEAACDISLAILFYVLLRPAGRNLALVAAFFGLFSTALYAVAEAFYFAPALILGGGGYLKAFSPEQLNALALLSFKLFERVAAIFIGFYGIATMMRGYLIYRSDYLPRILGLLFIIGGVGFVLQNLAIVLAPRVASPLLLIPMGVAGVPMMLWLLIKGVDVDRWQERRAVEESRFA